MIQDASDTLRRHRSAVLDGGHAEWHCWESWESPAQMSGGEMDSCHRCSLLTILAGLGGLMVVLVVVKIQKTYMHIYKYVGIYMHTPTHPLFSFFVHSCIYLA